MKAIILVAGLVVSISSFALAEEKRLTIVRRACKDVGFEETAWKQMQAQQPILKTHFDSMAQEYLMQTGEKLTMDKLENCTVEYPVDETDKAITGYRIAILSKTWYGDKGAKEYRAGLKIVYWLEYENPQTQYETKKRLLVGYSSCKSVVACNVLSIPVKSPTAARHAEDERGI